MKQETSPEPFRLRGVKLRSSRSVDLSSLDSIVRDITTGDMSDRDRAIAVWRFLHHHTYYSLYPKPFPLRDEAHPIGHLNMAPWGECGWAAGLFGRLLDAAGVRWRTVRLGKEGVWNSHVVVEAWFDGGWRYLDTGTGWYFHLRDGRTIAGVEDLLADNSLITNSSTREGFLSGAGADELREFARLSFSDSRQIVENLAAEPLSDEDRCAIDMARGDVWTLSCEKDGETGAWYCPAHLPDEDRRYAEWRNGYTLPGLGPRPIGEPVGRWPLPGFANSRLEYMADFAGGGYRDRVTAGSGLVADRGPCLRPEQLKVPGHAVFEIRSPFVIVRARVEAAVAVLGTRTDRFAISVSSDADPRRRHWTNLARFDYDMRRLLLLDLTPHVYGAFRYWVRVDLYAADRTAQDVRLESLRLVSVCQTSPLTVPRLGPGGNRIALELDNPEDLEGRSLQVEYCWREPRDAGRVEERIDRRVMDRRCMSYDLTVDAEKPATRYVRISLADMGRKWAHSRD